jgi:hypothetical protein
LFRANAQLREAAIAAEATAIVGDEDGNRVLPIIVAMTLRAYMLLAATILGGSRMALERRVDLLCCNGLCLFES